MRYVLLVMLFSLLALPGLATLDDAYLRDADYLGALRTVQTADDEVARAKADPDGAPLALTRAEERLAHARAALTLATCNVKLKIATALTDVLVARRQREVSMMKQLLAQMQLKAAGVRREAGAISAQDYAQAKDAAVRAGVTLATDTSNLDGTVLRLKPYGDAPADAPPLPAAFNEADCTIARHPVVLNAMNAAAEAQRAFDLAQGPDTAPRDRAARERELATATDVLRDTRRVQAETLDAALRRYRAARESVRVAQDSLVLSRDALAATQKRHAAGSVSQQAQLEAEIAVSESELAVEKASAELRLAHFAVNQATGGVL